MQGSPRNWNVLRGDGSFSTPLEGSWHRRNILCHDGTFYEATERSAPRRNVLWRRGRFYGATERSVTRRNALWPDARFSGATEGSAVPRNVLHCSATFCGAGESSVAAENLTGACGALREASARLLNRWCSVGQPICVGPIIRPFTVVQASLARTWVWPHSRPDKRNRRSLRRPVTRSLRGEPPQGAQFTREEGCLARRLRRRALGRSRESYATISLTLEQALKRG